MSVSELRTFAKFLEKERSVVYTREAMSGERYGRLVSWRWAEQLGDLTVHLSHLSDGMQETAFRDSLKARDGGWPQSLLGLRLALPRWFVHRVSDPHAAWREHGRHLPADLVLDPAQRATARPAVDLRIAL